MGSGACLKFLPCVDGVNAMATKAPLELCLSTTFCSHVSSFQIFTQNDSLSTFQGLPMEEYVEFKSKVTQVWSHGALQGLFIQMIKGEDLFIFSHLLILIATLQCPQINVLITLTAHSKMPRIFNISMILMIPTPFPPPLLSH